MIWQLRRRRVSMASRLSSTSTVCKGWNQSLKPPASNRTGLLRHSHGVQAVPSIWVTCIATPRTQRQERSGHDKPQKADQRHEYMMKRKTASQRAQRPSRKIARRLPIVLWYYSAITRISTLLMMSSASTGTMLSKCKSKRRTSPIALSIRPPSQFRIS